MSTNKMEEYFFQKKGRYKKLGERKYSKIVMIYLSNTQLRIDGESGSELIIPLNKIKNLNLCKKQGLVIQKEPRRVSIQTDTSETYFFISNYLERLHKQLSEVIANSSNGREVQIDKEKGIGPEFWNCLVVVIIVIIIVLFYAFTRLIGSI